MYQHHMTLEQFESMRRDGVAMLASQLERMKRVVDDASESAANRAMAQSWIEKYKNDVLDEMLAHLDRMTKDER
jgi:hypothetical protein